jgi:cell division protease FtsH
MMLGGRAAEDLFFGKISTGALSDLERVTKTAYSMITMYGMNSKVGHVSFNDPKGEYGFSKPYSEKTAELIDNEVRLLIENAYQRTLELLTEKRAETEIIAKALLEKEIIFQADLVSLIGKRPFDQKTNYQNFMDSPASDAVEENPEEQPIDEVTDFDQEKDS